MWGAVISSSGLPAFTSEPAPGRHASMCSDMLAQLFPTALRQGPELTAPPCARPQSSCHCGAQARCPALGLIARAVSALRPCREDWHTFAPRAGETVDDYKMRLGHIFSFSKTAVSHQRIPYPRYFASAVPAAAPVRPWPCMPAELPASAPLCHARAAQLLAGMRCTGARLRPVQLGAQLQTGCWLVHAARRAALARAAVGALIKPGAQLLRTAPTGVPCSAVHAGTRCDRARRGAHAAGGQPLRVALPVPGAAANGRALAPAARRGGCCCCRQGQQGTPAPCQVSRCFPAPRHCLATAQQQAAHAARLSSVPYVRTCVIAGRQQHGLGTAWLSTGSTCAAAACSAGSRAWRAGQEGS